MIGLLDPALFLPRSGVNAESQLRHELDLVLATCRRHALKLPPFDAYWPHLWRSLGRPLEKQAGKPVREALQQIRRCVEASKDLAAVAAPVGRVWRRGFQQLFDWNGLGQAWEGRMAAAAV